MKVIDLLNKIANNEEVPEKIKWGNREFEYIFNDYQEDNEYRTRFMSLLEFNDDYLNDEIEIIEEKPKKIEEIKKSYPIFNFDEKSFDAMKDMLQDVYSKQIEVINIVNYLLEKESDK